MASVNLTKKTVDQLAPRDKDYIAYDQSLPGFGVRVTRTGSKSWIVEFRSQSGGRRSPKQRHTIGSTSVLTPVQARKAAQDILARVRLGEDIIGEKAARRQAPTIAELAKKYMAEEILPKRKPATARLYKTYLRLHIVPKLGSAKARDVTRGDIAKFHREIGERHPAGANRMLTLLSGMFSWAAKVGEIPEGIKPASNIEKFREEGRERFLTTEEFARLGDALREAETVGLPWSVDEAKATAKHAPRPENRREKISPFAIAAIRLLIFTGCRLREILHLRWENVDFERGMLFLPDSKTGRKPVVLSLPAIDILKELPKGGQYVVPGDYGDHFRHDLKRPWRALTKYAGLVGVRIHDLRHSFAATGVASGFGLPVLGKLLGHRNLETTNRYAHVAADPMRIASNSIGEKISAAMDSNNKQSSVCPPN